MSKASHGNKFPTTTCAITVVLVAATMLARLPWANATTELPELLPADVCVYLRINNPAQQWQTLKQSPRTATGLAETLRPIAADLRRKLSQALSVEEEKLESLASSASAIHVVITSIGSDHNRAYPRVLLVFEHDKSAKLDAFIAKAVKQNRIRELPLRPTEQKLFLLQWAGVRTIGLLRLGRFTLLGRKEDLRRCVAVSRNPTAALARARGLTKIPPGDVVGIVNIPQLVDQLRLVGRRQHRRELAELLEELDVEALRYAIFSAKLGRPAGSLQLQIHYENKGQLAELLGRLENRFAPAGNKPADCALQIRLRLRPDARTLAKLVAIAAGLKRCNSAVHLATMLTQLQRSWKSSPQLPKAVRAVRIHWRRRPVEANSVVIELDFSAAASARLALEKLVSSARQDGISFVARPAAGESPRIFFAGSRWDLVNNNDPQAGAYCLQENRLILSSSYRQIEKFLKSVPAGSVEDTPTTYRRAEGWAVVIEGKGCPFAAEGSQERSSATERHWRVKLRSGDGRLLLQCDWPEIIAATALKLLPFRLLEQDAAESE